MPSGVEIRDANGNVVLDGTKRLLKFLGEITVGGSGSAASGTLVDSRFALAEPFAWALTDDANWVAGDDIEVNVSGSTLTWRFPTYSGKPVTRIIYGIF